MKPGARILKAAGILCILVGSLDPLEGSVLILAGSGLVALAARLGPEPPSVFREWRALFLMIAFGVLQLFELSAFGGIGGKEGHSLWWGVLILPYVAGWVLALVRIFADTVGWIRMRWRRPKVTAP